MKFSLLLLAGATACSLGACSSNSTTATTTSTTPADSTGTAMSTTTTTSDATYHTRGDRMATRFASQNKITDEATLGKLKTAYYNRARRYDEMIAKFKADTAGMATARRDYMKANDQEFQTILLVPTQYQAYQSSQSTYDEANNLDTNDQGAAASSATIPSADSTAGAAMSPGTTTTAGDNMSSGMSSGAAVKSSKTKLEDGSKMKVKDDGTVKLRDASGSKTKM